MDGDAGRKQDEADAGMSADDKASIGMYALCVGGVLFFFIAVMVRFLLDGNDNRGTPEPFADMYYGKVPEGADDAQSLWEGKVIKRTWTPFSWSGRMRFDKFLAYYSSDTEKAFAAQGEVWPDSKEEAFALVDEWKEIIEDGIDVDMEHNPGPTEYSMRVGGLRDMEDGFCYKMYMYGYRYNGYDADADPEPPYNFAFVWAVRDRNEETGNEEWHASLHVEFDNIRDIGYPLIKNGKRCP